MLSEKVRGRVRAAQALVGSLVAGVVVLTGVLAALAPGVAGDGSGDSMEGPLLVTLAILTVALLGMAYGVLPIVRRKITAAVWRNAPPEIDAGEARALFMNNALVSGAMAEAVGLLGAVVYMLTQRPEALLAPAAAVAAMLITFPTLERFRALVRATTGRDSG